MGKIGCKKDPNFSAPKEVYKLHPDIKKLLMADETKEEVDAYFEHIEACKCFSLCSDCGQVVDFGDERYKEEHIKEYSISALCISCQEKAFGL
jgi:hypothetical protein